MKIIIEKDWNKLIKSNYIGVTIQSGPDNLSYFQAQHTFCLLEGIKV